MTLSISKKNKNTQDEVKVQSSSKLTIASEIKSESKISTLRTNTYSSTESKLIGFEALEISHQQILLSYKRMQEMFIRLESQIKEKRNLDEGRYNDCQIVIKQLENQLQNEHHQKPTTAIQNIQNNSTENELKLEENINILTTKCEDLERTITSLRTQIEEITQKTTTTTTTTTTLTSNTQETKSNDDDDEEPPPLSKKTSNDMIYKMLPNSTGDSMHNSICLLQQYIAQLDENQLYMHWDTTAKDMFGNTECNRAKVNTGRFFALIIANIADYAIDWLGMEKMRNITTVIANLAKMMQRGFVHPQRIKKELFAFQKNDELTRTEYGQHFISLVNDPDCDIRIDALYDSMCISPSFVHSYVPIEPHFQAMRMITNNAPLAEDLIDETVARLAMAVLSKLGAGARIGSILLDFNSDQRASIVRQYNRNVSSSDSENAFTRDIMNLKDTQKPSKVFLNLLQYSVPELDKYWLLEAAKNGKIDAIYEILATRTPSQIKKCVDKSVRQGISDKFGKDEVFVYMANRIMDGNRDTSLQCSERECYLDAQNIYNSFYSVKNVNSKSQDSNYMDIYEFLCDRSWAHIRYTAELYLSMARIDLESDMVKFLKKEKKCKFAVTFAAMIMEAARDIIAYFAQVLTDSMSGMGMRTFDFNRVVLSRCEMDLAQINYRFSSCREYGSGTSVLSWIMAESGINFPVYRQLVLKMFGVASNAQASQYQLRHYSLTVCNPTCMSSRMRGLGGKSDAVFDANAEIDKCMGFLKKCTKAAKTDHSFINKLFTYLYEMSLNERCEMNDAYTLGGGRTQLTHMVSQSSVDDFKDVDPKTPGADDARISLSPFSAEDIFQNESSITEQFEMIVTRGKKKHQKTWKSALRILRGCFEPLAEFDAYSIHDYFGRKKLAEVGCLLGCRTDGEIHAILIAYQKMYKQNLHQFSVARCKTAKKNTCRDILDNILSCKRAAEHVSNVKPSEVHLDCVSLMSPTKNRSVKMEFVRVLTMRSWKHIRCINDHYNRMSNDSNLEQFLASSLSSGESATILTCLLRFALDPVSYFTDSIISLSNGDYLEFGRILVSRSEIDLKAIDVQFSLKHKKKCSLAMWMENESKNYPPLLVGMFTALLQARDQYRRVKFEHLKK